MNSLKSISASPFRSRSFSVWTSERATQGEGSEPGKADKLCESRVDAAIKKKQICLQVKKRNGNKVLLTQQSALWPQAKPLYFERSPVYASCAPRALFSAVAMHLTRATITGCPPCMQFWLPICESVAPDRLAVSAWLDVHSGGDAGARVLVVCWQPSSS